MNLHPICLVCLILGTILCCLTEVFPFVSFISNFCVLHTLSKLSQPDTAVEVMASKMSGLEIGLYVWINSRRTTT